MYTYEFLDRALPLLLIFNNDRAVGSVEIDKTQLEKWTKFLESLNESENSDVSVWTK